MDQELVFVVEDAFCIRGRGTILIGVPLARPASDWDELECASTGKAAQVLASMWHSRAIRTCMPSLIASETGGFGR